MSSYSTKEFSYKNCFIENLNSYNIRQIQFLVSEIGLNKTRVITESTNKIYSLEMYVKSLLTIFYVDKKDHPLLLETIYLKELDTYVFRATSLKTGKTLFFERFKRE